MLVLILKLNRKNSSDYHELKLGNVDSLLSSDYDHSKVTRIFIHGFMMNGYDDDRVLQLRDGKLICILHNNKQLR